jgi:hypothetical protein
MGIHQNNTTGAVKECRYIKTNGLKCQSPAMRGSAFCYFHGRTRITVSPGQKREKPLQLPPLRNAASIHAALNQVMQALGSGNIGAKRAGNLLYALQMAQQTVSSLPVSQFPPRRPPSDR